MCLLLCLLVVFLVFVVRLVLFCLVCLCWLLLEMFGGVCLKVYFVCGAVFITFVF